MAQNKKIRQNKHQAHSRSNKPHPEHSKAPPRLNDKDKSTDSILNKYTLYKKITQPISILPANAKYRDAKLYNIYEWNVKKSLNI